MKKNFFIKFAKGILIGIIVSLLLICILTLITKSVELSDDAISGICIAIKVIGVFLSCLFALGGEKKKPVAWGSIVALTYWLICFLARGIFSGFALEFSAGIDLFATLIVGIISAFIVKALTR